MRKDQLIKEWIDHNIAFWKGIKLRAKLHGSLSNASNLPEEVLKDAAPIFVLSTGRVGTKLLTKLFELESNLHIEHEALPELLYPGKIAFESPEDLSFLKGAFLAGRYEGIRDAKLQGKRYIETNNRLTFFAPAIAELFPNAKFIHLLRHPDSFVSSGIQRNWYSGKTITDEGRIQPPANLAEASTPDKIAWLWNETNAFIEAFKANQGKDRTLTVRSEDLFSNVTEAHRILDWLEFNADEKRVKNVLDTPVNKSRKKKEKQAYNSELVPLSKHYYPR
jgi:hypothetical protein